MAIINRLSLLGLTLFALTASAKTELLESSTRPRIRDTLAEHLGYRPAAGIPLEGGRLNYAWFKNALEEGAPHFFAQLESAYPGATFAFLGRDTQTIADIVEAIYLSLGQSDRVEQVGVSKPTLESLTDAQIVKYLENFGFKLADVLDKPPFIMVDTISKGDTIGNALISGRQGRRILQAVYSEWVRMGRDVRQLLPKFNMIGLRVRTFQSKLPDNQYRYVDISNVEIARTTNLQRMQQAKMNNGQYGYEMMIPLIVDTPKYFNEAGYDHFTGAWHDKFQPPKPKATGELQPAPGALMADSYRQSIIWLQHQIIDVVNSSRFRDRVAAESENSGLKINFSKRAKLRACRHVYK